MVDMQACIQDRQGLTLEALEDTLEEEGIRLSRNKKNV